MKRSFQELVNVWQGSCLPGTVQLYIDHVMDNRLAIMIMTATKLRLLTKMVTQSLILLDLHVSSLRFLSLSLLLFRALNETHRICKEHHHLCLGDPLVEGLHWPLHPVPCYEEGDQDAAV